VPATAPAPANGARRPVLPDPDEARRIPTRLWQRVVLAALSRSARSIQRMPRARAMRIGATLGRLAFRLSKRHRRQAERNLRLVFGDAMDRAERAAFIERVFVHFGKTLVDFLRAPALLGPSDLENLISACEGFDEHVRPAIERGVGLVCLTGHIGNWELLARWMGTRGVPLSVVARDPKDPALADYVRKLRASNGVTTLTKGTSARELLRILRRGGGIALLPDQNSADVFVPFFGVPTGTVAGPASLALHTRVPLLFAACVREPDDRYRLIFLPPIDTTPSENGSGGDVARVMTEVNRALESVIRRYPDQWLWLHGRWRASFEDKHRHHWPDDLDFEAFARRWRG